MSEPPPNQPRPKALAALDPLIARAKEVVKFLRRAVERLTVAGGDSGRGVALLRRAEEYLAQLRESRRTLLEGEAEDQGKRRKAEAGRLRERRNAPSKGAGEP